MRAFIACDIAHPGIKDVIGEFKKSGAAVKFVDLKNTHITLKFFPDIDDDSAGKVGAALQQVCLQNGPMEARLAGAGVFPSQNYMRVLWIGLVCPGLETLQHRLDDALFEIGFKREKNFKPHLTIGRVQTGKNKDALLHCVEALKDRDIGTIRIEEVKFKESVLTPKGPIYTDIMVASL